VNRRGAIRASDSEREQVADRLRNAAAEGRLLAEELEQRLTRALRARTVGELDALVDDLPARRARPRKRELTPVRVAALTIGVSVAAVAAIVLAALVLAGLAAGWFVWLFLFFWFRDRRHRRTLPPPVPLGWTGRRRLL
jgi:Flp pilus assembly protein TadB